MEIGQRVKFRNWLSNQNQILEGKIVRFFNVLEEPCAKVLLDSESAEKFGATEAGPLVSNINKETEKQ